MSETSDDQMEEQVAHRYLFKINEALGELTLDEVRQVISELETQVLDPIKPSAGMADSSHS